MKTQLIQTNQILQVSNFEDLIDFSFSGNTNALCWQRDLLGDFSALVNTIEVRENITVIDESELKALSLNEGGQLAREEILLDMKLLTEQGAAPVLNLIQYYERDEALAFFPTDVYSWHVDRSPIPTSTFLCTYCGAASELLPNSQAEQKILIPEIRAELRQHFQGSEEAFDSFLSEHFFDLHYREKLDASAVTLGNGHLWRLAVDHPESAVLPCVHRAPKEREGEARLLLIC